MLLFPVLFAVFNQLLLPLYTILKGILGDWVSLAGHGTLVCGDIM